MLGPQWLVDRCGRFQCTQRSRRDLHARGKPWYRGWYALQRRVIVAPRSTATVPAPAMSSPPAESALRFVRLWDLPTRLFHWLLTLTVVGSVASGLIGGNAMVWHVRLGRGVLALLAFRLAWGFVGGHWSRFAAFVYGPRSVIAYLRGEAGPGGRYDIGHSPVGALSVWALLGLLATRRSVQRTRATTWYASRTSRPRSRRCSSRSRSARRSQPTRC